MNVNHLIQVYNNCPVFRKTLNYKVDQKRIQRPEDALQIKHRIAFPAKDFARAMNKNPKLAKGAVKKRISHLAALAVSEQTETLFSLLSGTSTKDPLWFSEDFTDKADVIKILFESGHLKDAFKPEYWIGHSQKMKDLYHSLPEHYRLSPQAGLDDLHYFRSCLGLHEVSQSSQVPKIRRRKVSL